MMTMPKIKRRRQGFSSFQNGMGILLVFITFAFLLFTPYLHSQNVTAKAELDTKAILIGKQAKIKLTVQYKTDQGNIKIEFPKIADSLIKQIEVRSEERRCRERVLAGV